MDNLTKLAIKYKLKYKKTTRKLLKKKIRELRSLHKQAKKLKLRITKQVKGKRIYKSSNQLIKELKKKNKNKNKFGVNSRSQTPERRKRGRSRTPERGESSIDRSRSISPIRYAPPSSPVKKRLPGKTFDVQGVGDWRNEQRQIDQHLKDGIVGDYLIFAGQNQEATYKSELQLDSDGNKIWEQIEDYWGVIE